MLPGVPGVPLSPGVPWCKDKGRRRCDLISVKAVWICVFKQRKAHAEGNSLIPLWFQGIQGFLEFQEILCRIDRPVNQIKFKKKNKYAWVSVQLCMSTNAYLAGIPTDHWLRGLFCLQSLQTLKADTLSEECLSVTLRKKSHQAMRIWTQYKMMDCHFALIKAEQ